MEKRVVDLQIPGKLEGPHWLYDHEAITFERKRQFKGLGIVALLGLSTMIASAILGLGSKWTGMGFVFGGAVSFITLMLVVTNVAPSQKTQIKTAGIAANLIPQLARSIKSYNEKVELLQKFVEKKRSLDLATSPDMEAILQRKVEELTATRSDLRQKIAMVSNLYGLHEEEFDDISEILFSEHPEATESIQVMLMRSIEKLSSRVEVEEDLSVRSIERERKRLGKK